MLRVEIERLGRLSAVDEEVLEDIDASAGREGDSTVDEDGTTVILIGANDAIISCVRKRRAT